MSVLSQALEFTDKDLRANREGHITHSQKTKLRRRRAIMIVSYGLLIPAFVAFFVAIIAPSVRDVINNRYPLTVNSLFPVIWVGLGSLILAVILTAGVIIKWNQFNLDISEGRATAINGKVIVGGGFPTRNGYTLWIEKVQLEIPKQALDAIITGETYQVYYSPHSKFLLSLEEYKRKRQ